MRMMKTGGFTPCGRRLDRRKVAVAAFAALWLSAASARAAVVDFMLDHAQSSLKFVFNANGLNGVLGATQPDSKAQQALVPSDTAKYQGHLLFDVTANTIQMLPGQGIVPDYTGSYFPGENPNGTVNGTLNAPGNYGVEYNRLQKQPDGSIANVSTALQRILNMKMDSRTGNPVRTMTLNGPVFEFSLGTTSVTQVLGTTEMFDGVIGVIPKQNWATQVNAGVAAVGQTQQLTNANPGLLGTLDPVTGHLVIPVNMQVQIGASAATGLHGIPTIWKMTGQLVMDWVVPEPSTVTLMGFGVVGLLGYAWRVRKRRAVVS